MLSRASSKKRRHDVSQLAKAVVDISAGNMADEAPSEPPKNPAAVALDELDGRKGRLARPAKQTKKRRPEIAKKAAQVRWSRK